MPQLQAGRGAKASVLTKMIKPKQTIPNGDNKTHRSDIVLEERFENEKGKEVYSFRFSGDDSEGLFLHASVRYVKIIEEGEKEGLMILVKGRKER